MADNVDLEELVHLEQTFYDAGYKDGFAHGRIHGLIEGRALGREKGFEIWDEIAFYQGFARTWQAIYAAHPARRDQRAERHMAYLLDLVGRFPTSNPTAPPMSSSSTGAPAPADDDDDAFDMTKLQAQIRARYRALCASLGVRPALPAASGAAAMGHDGAGSEAGTRHEMWTVEGEGRRSTMQGLSF